MVWIPANTPAEPSNCISAYEVDPDAPNQVAPALNPQAANFGPTAGGLTYLVQPGSDKYNKIASAAILACMPISPSRDLGFSAGDAAAAGAVVQEVYASVAPASQSNAAVPRDWITSWPIPRTTRRCRFASSTRTKSRRSITYFLDPNPAEFAPNELGWQDTVTVTVNHDLALLPGPGRLLARWVVGPGGRNHHRSRHVLQLPVDGLDYHGQRGREIGASLCLPN